MKTIRFTPIDLSLMEAIQSKHKLKSLAETIRFCVKKASEKELPKGKVIIDKDGEIWIDPFAKEREPEPPVVASDDPWKNWKVMERGYNETEGYEYVAIKQQVKPWQTKILKYGDEGYDAS